MSTTTYHTVHLPVRDGIDLAYAQAGNPKSPTLILLHGFPTSSNQYRRLIPRLSDKYHVLAPDLPGFGSTVVYGDESSNLTFELLADALEGFVDALGVKTFAVYIFDYGAPTAFRFALRRPGTITAVISQNGNAYDEGLGQFWDPVKALWATQKGTPAFDAALAPLAPLLSLEATKGQYTQGTPADRLDRIDPATYTLDYYQNLAGHADTQVSLFYDYRNNVTLYPQFQSWLRDSRVPVLAVWGKGDEIFVPAGAEAFKRDTEAEVHLLDGGHFLLETHVDEVASLIRSFLERIKFGAA